MSQRVVMGRISGVFGVKGWIKVFSHTQPRENIKNYTTWLVSHNGQDWREMQVEAGQQQGKAVVVKLQGIDNREDALALRDAEIAVMRDWLPEAADGEYYWSDLQGLTVKCLNGEVLGQIDHLFETGANDVIVVKGEQEHLIPFVMGDYVKEVSLTAGEMIVDWDPEF